MAQASKTKREKSPYQVPNLERALAMIELLAGNSSGLNLSEISEALGAPKNSVFRIGMTLQSKGYLLRCERSKRFRLSRKFLSLGCGSLGDESLVELSLDAMRELRDKTKETVLMGTIIGAEGVVLEQIPGKHNFKFLVDPGLRFPLHTAAPGKAMLAFMPEKERDDIIKKMSFDRFTENTITAPKRFTAELEKVRKTGYALDHQEEISGQHCVAAPILSDRGQAVASIWITAPAHRLTEEMFKDVGPLVKTASEKVSLQLGHRFAVVA